MDIPSYQVGYADASAGRPSQFPVVPPPAPAPGVQVLPPGPDLTATLNALPSGAKVQLVKGGVYTASGPITLAAGVSVDCNSTNITFTSPSGTTSLFAISNPNCEVFNLLLTPMPANRVNVLFRVQADSFYAHDCIIKDGLFAVTITNTKGTNAKFSNLMCGKTASMTMYTEADNSQWLNCTFAGSLNETTVRTSPDPTGRTASGLVVQGCTIYGGGADKGAMEWRQHKNGKLTNCDLRDYARFGQLAATALAQWGSVNLSGVKFAATVNPVLPQILISSGMDLAIDGCLLQTPVNQVGVSVGAWCKAALTNNVRQLVPAGSAGYRQKLWSTAVAIGPSYPVVTESGSVVK